MTDQGKRREAPGAPGRPGRPGGSGPRRVAARSLILAAAVLVAALLAAVAVDRGHGGKAVESLASLEPGQWVRVEGAMRADSAARCDELRLLIGDFMDDDWTLKGFLQAVDTLKGEFTIAGVRARATEDTRFDSPRKNFRRMEELRAGLLVEIEGSYLKSGKFVALEVDDETDELARRPWATSRFMIVGRVERVNARKRLVTAMGIVLEVTERTRFRSVIE